MAYGRVGLHLLSLVVLLGLACTPNKPFTRPNIQGTAFLNRWAESQRCESINARVSTYNRETLADNYGHEWAFNRGDGHDDAPPRLGLALSGGGVRSASFSIGVMKALQQDGVLDRVDVISGVSGGSYALYWYYTQMLNFQPSHGAETPEVIFKSCNHREINDGFSYIDYDTGHSCDPLDPQYRYQRHLEQNARLLFGSQSRFKRMIDGTWKGSTWALSWPVSILVNLLFDTGLNVNPFAYYYERGIRRTYGLTPTPGGGPGYLNQADWTKEEWTAPSVRPTFAEAPSEELALREVGGDLRAKDLPFFIINTRAVYGESRVLFRPFGEEDRSLRTSVFEITPQGYGADSFGYQYYEPPAGRDLKADLDLEFSRAVSISGAALDVKGLDPLLTLMNLHLGRHISNYNRSTWNRVIYRVTPFPLYYGFNRRLDNQSPDIFLTDGGHAENLGVFSLIRRGVRTIIAVDAEHDDRSSFSSAIALKRALRDELGIEFDLERKGLFDTLSHRGELLKGSVTVLEGKPHPGNGEAGHAPVACSADEESDPSSPATLRIVYVKLAVDRSRLDQHACTDLKPSDFFCERFEASEIMSGSALESTREREYLDFCNQFEGAERLECLRMDACTQKRLYPCSIADYAVDEDEQFPHVSTGDISFSPEQFRAYRDLGFETITGHLLVDPATQEVVLTRDTPAARHRFD